MGFHGAVYYIDHVESSTLQI